MKKVQAKKFLLKFFRPTSFDSQILQLTGITIRNMWQPVPVLFISMPFIKAIIFKLIFL